MLRRVVIVAFDGCQALDVIGPLEVFSGARAAQVRRRARDPGYAPLVAATTRPVRSESGLDIFPQATLAAVTAAVRPPSTRSSSQAEKERGPRRVTPPSCA